MTTQRSARRGATRILLWVMSTLTVLVLLFGYRTSWGGADQLAGGTVAPIVSSASTPGSSGSPGSAGPAGTTSGAGRSSGGAGTGAPSGSAARTITGPAVDTRYGPVQVELTVTGSGASASISGVAVVQYPHSSGGDAQVNGYALPILVQETIDAQSAHVDMVSGATYTSTGYQTSLQAALDQAQA